MAQGDPPRPGTARLGVFENHLVELEAADRRRRLRGRAGIDFSSNDYLGLAAGAELRAAAAAALARGVAVGAGGSRLLRGQDEEHAALEREAAAFFGVERALFFGGGFQANLAFFASAPQRGDLVVYDALIHASAHDGMRLGRAERAAFAHNDADAARDAIRAWRAEGGRGRAWIAVESLYSMDGDRAPLAELAAAAAEDDAWLVVDEAHSTGVDGPGGRGLAAAFGLEGRDDVITLHTCGKALGASGALLCGPGVIAEFMVNRARPFIYATAPSPLAAAIVRAALPLAAAADDRRAALAARVARLAAGLAPLAGRADVQAAPSGSHVQPVILGADARAMTAAGRLQRAGFDVRGVRPPTVPDGSARLRVALTLNAGLGDVDALAAALADALAAA
ncbi:MAG: aminotransferase class I/II-fold pyridoxal phosphate-dependent enzyme [Pseudomonadota bacterium]